MPQQWQSQALSLATKRINNKHDTAADRGVEDGGTVRLEVDRRMDELMNNRGNSYKWLRDGKTNFSAPLGMAVTYMVGLFDHHKAKDTSKPLGSTEMTDHAVLAFRKLLKPGEIEFKFPVDTTRETSGPSRYYHSLEGTTLLYVDWKLAFPDQALICFNCSRGAQEKQVHLHHDRTNFSHRHSLFPIWSHSGLPTWCVLMTYECPECKTRYQANDCRLLFTLPPHVQAAYPVEPNYAWNRHNFHFHKDFSDELQNQMRTYGNGKVISEKLSQKLLKEYERKLYTFYSLGPTDTIGFMSFREWKGSIKAPDDDIIRQYFEEAERSPFRPYGYSNYDRYKREMQGVCINKDESAAFDHTFGPLKNYRLKGVMATMNKSSTKEIALLAIVPSTKASDVSHLLIAARKNRKEFSPGILYTDTCPNNKQFFGQIFGDSVEMKLGLFHFIQRMVKTLDKRSYLYWECLVELQAAIYSYDEQDYSNLVRVLKDGSFNGKVMSSEDIEELRRSKEWKSRFSCYLRKKIKPPDSIKQALEVWIAKWEGKCDTNNQQVFTGDTRKATEEQFKKLEYIGDKPTVESYKEVPAGPRSTHGLSKWVSQRPESALEKAFTNLTWLL